MTLVYPAAEPATDTAMTHVLIVGVGEYFHLPGGPMFAVKKARHKLGLKQLTSPPVSAQKLCNWFIDKLTSSHKNPKAALGTVELLLSPQAYTDSRNKVTQVEAATFDNIKAGFERWLQRCDGHPDSIAIFYFCGHGIEWDKSYLLPADYGRDFGTPWENVIDFTISRLGFLGDCKAKTLCCFLDACRQVTIDMIQNLNFGARPLWNANSPPKGDYDALVYRATRFGEKAHGPPGQISYFTQALIDCLERLGAGGPPNGPTWSVSTSSLGQALRQVMRRTMIPNFGPGVCDVSGGPCSTPEPTLLLDLPLAYALAEINYNPETALELAELSYCLSGSATPPTTRVPPGSNPWQIEVAAGTYDVAAVFHDGQHLPDRRANQIVWPPFTRCTLGGNPP